MLEQFEGSYGNYKLEKGILHVNYVLKCFPVETFIYSLTSLSLTLYVVFVSFVHVLNPLLNLSRSGGPRRLWGCSWTSRGPMQTLGSTLITRVTSYLCYFFQVLPRGWCEWKRYLIKSWSSWYIFPHICFIHEIYWSWLQLCLMVSVTNSVALEYKIYLQWHLGSCRWACPQIHQITTY